MNEKFFPVTELDFILETLDEYEDELEDKKEIVEKIKKQIKTIREKSNFPVSLEKKEIKEKREHEWKNMYYELIHNPLIRKVMTSKAFEQKNYLGAAYGIEFTLDNDENYDKLENLFESKIIDEESLIQYRLGLHFLLDNPGFKNKFNNQEEKGL